MSIISILLSGETYKLRKYRIWKGLIRDYKKYPLNPIGVARIHHRGFTTGDWEILGLTKDNFSTYLSSKQYTRCHPINGYYSKIIDDKINIKYVFYGTDLGCYMPDYYYLLDENGIIMPLMDCGSDGRANSSDLLNLLEERKMLALKLVTGSIGKGFYKAEYREGSVFLNGRQMNVEEFLAFIPSLRNYIASEYLVTHPYLAQFWPSTANTLRYLVGQVNGEWRMIKSFIRFGSAKSGMVENFNAGGVLCYINEDGHFHGGYIIGKEGKRACSIPVDVHPDTKMPLDGDIPCWDEVRKCAEGIEQLLPQTKYLGFDFVVTDRNTVKLLEINSLTSLDSIQLDGSILETENGKWFFSSLLS